MSKKRQRNDLEGYDDEKSKAAMSEVEDIRKDIYKSAMKTIYEVMPSKVVKLTKMLKEDPLYSGSPLDANPDDLVVRDHKKNDVSVKIFDEQVEQKRNLCVECNKDLVKAVDQIKTELLALIDNIGIVKVWIQLNRPRIEDGNNFGVSVQDEVISELSRTEDSAFSIMESMTQYFVTRAKIVSKCMKYPGIADYKRSVSELDEKEKLHIRLSAKDLRDDYARLNVIVLNNIEKLKTPRSQNHLTNFI